MTQVNPVQIYELALLKGDMPSLKKIELVHPNLAYTKLSPANTTSRPILYWLNHILKIESKEKKSVYLKDLWPWLEKTIEYIKKEESDIDYVLFMNIFYLESELKNITSSSNDNDDDFDFELYYYLSLIITKGLEELNSMSKAQSEQLLTITGLDTKIDFAQRIKSIGNHYYQNQRIGPNSPHCLFYDFKMKSELDILLESQFNNIDYSQDFPKIQDQFHDVLNLILDFRTFKTVEEKTKIFFEYLIKFLASCKDIKNFEIYEVAINTPFLTQTIDIKELIPQVKLIAPEYQNVKINKALYCFLFLKLIDSFDDSFYKLFSKNTAYHLDITPSLSTSMLSYIEHCLLSPEMMYTPRTAKIDSKLATKEFIKVYLSEMRHIMKHAAYDDEQKEHWLSKFKETLIFAKNSYIQERERFMSDPENDQIAKIIYIEKNRYADSFIDSEAYLSSLEASPLNKTLTKSEEMFNGAVLDFTLELWLPIMIKDYKEFPYRFNFDDKTQNYIMKKIQKDYPTLNLATPNNFNLYDNSGDHNALIAEFKKTRISEIESKILYSEIKEKIVNKPKKSTKI